MIHQSIRTQRVAQEIKKNIAIILQNYIKDPRLNMIITVSGIELSRDLSYAKVFITFLNDNTLEQINVGIQTLQHASGFIRNILGKVLFLRIIPELFFIYDYSLKKGIKITNLVNKIIKNNSNKIN